MSVLILGLLVFLGTHSLRIVGEGWRGAQIARLGLQRWKAIYSLVSAVGLGLIVWGYGLARAESPVFWGSPAWARHLAGALTLPAFILLVAAYVPGTRIKAAVGHPMLAGVKVWALAHLLANGKLSGVILFGAFLAWAVADFIASRRRDRAAGRRYPAQGLARDVIAVVLGSAIWAAFAFWGHAWLIGVAPFRIG